jgi:hypothetical protein
MARLGRYSVNRIKIEELTASKTVTVADCGTLFVVNPAADTTLTLPSAVACGKGWWVKVMIDEEDGGTVDNDVNIAISDGTSFTGVLSTSDGSGASVGTGATGTAHSHIVFDAGTSTSGEMVRVVCLGDRFVAHGLIVDATDTKFFTAALS